MSKRTIRDETGQEWAVEIDVQPSDDMLIPTLANFYVFHPADMSKRSRYPIGHVYISIHNEDKTTAKIEDLEVNPELENRGIGSSLLELIEEWVRNHGIRKLIGDLSNVDGDHLDKLRHIYKKHGYIFALSSAGEKNSSVFIGKIEKVIDNPVN